MKYLIKVIVCMRNKRIDQKNQKKKDKQKQKLYKKNKIK